MMRGVIHVDGNRPIDLVEAEPMELRLQEERDKRVAAEQRVLNLLERVSLQETEIAKLRMREHEGKKAGDDLLALRSSLNAIFDALWFYADQESWKGRKADPIPQSPIDRDGGERARMVLDRATR